MNLLAFFIWARFERTYIALVVEIKRKIVRCDRQHSPEQANEKSKKISNKKATTKKVAVTLPTRWLSACCLSMCMIQFNLMWWPRRYIVLSHTMTATVCLPFARVYELGASVIYNWVRSHRQDQMAFTFGVRVFCVLFHFAIFDFNVCVHSFLDSPDEMNWANSQTNEKNASHWIVDGSKFRSNMRNTKTNIHIYRFDGRQ